MLQRGGMTPPTCVLLAGLLMALVSGPVQAQSTDGDPALLDDGRPLPVPPAVIAGNDRGVTVRATRITAPMTIDGRLDEAIYAQVPAITAFVQQEPRYGTAVSEATSAWVFYDDANFYVACRCLMADMGQVVANDMRRDSTNLRQNDNFGVFLDYVSRPPQRLPLLRVAGGRHVRRGDGQRAHQQRRLEHGVEREGDAVARRVVG